MDEQRLSANTQKDSNTQLLQELEALSQTMYQSHISTRRTASLALPRSSIPSITVADRDDDDDNDNNINTTTNQLTAQKLNVNKPRTRRMSLSPWRSKKPPENEPTLALPPPTQKDSSNLFAADPAATPEKKKIWNWKPLRALSHIGMQKLSCLFSVEVVAVQGLPASMNALRLSICVRKKETKDGAVHTMPSVVTQGGADFEETLFMKCHVYFTPPTTTTPIKFDPRPFLIYVFAIDAPELDLGKSSVDLSRLIQESMEKTNEGARIRQWDTSFRLSGKAKGGELAVKLGFQIMEKDGGGISIFSHQSEAVSSNPVKSRNFSMSSTSFARKQSKTSFSIPSPKVSSRMEVWTPSQRGAAGAMTENIPGFEDLNLDEPAPLSPPKPKAPETKPEEDMLDLPDFEVVDKGIEIQETVNDNKDLDDSLISEKMSESSEVVKEVVHDQHHLTRLAELDSIAQQIKALESMMGSEKTLDPTTTDEGTHSTQGLDADEETVTREFLQMLEYEEATTTTEFKHHDHLGIPQSKLHGSQKEATDTESEVYLPDLGKGLGCVIQTKNGGYLAAMNPLQVPMLRKETPKLAMQISKPLVITSTGSMSGFELFQTIAADGFEVVTSTALSQMPTNDIMGKTPEQVAFEGIASAIIHGREKEGANSTAARTVAAVKTIANAMSTGRKERIETGIWNVSEDPIAAYEILPFSMQKIEAMLIDALKIQAGVAEEDSPFDVSPLSAKRIGGGDDQGNPLTSAITIDQWIDSGNKAAQESGAVITLAVLIQLHDPMRRYEVVGGTVMALIQATHVQPENHNTEKKFKVANIHIGGIKVSKEQKRNSWDGEKQRLTALQWLVAYGFTRAGRKRPTPPLDGRDKVWSISSRIMADMWLKPIRNPDVKFIK